MKEVWVIADTPVRDEDKTGKIQAVDILFQTFSQGQVVQGVAGEGLDGDGDALIVHEQPHLNNGEFAFFLADAHPAQSFFQDISLFIQDILIRRSDLEIEVCYIIIDDLRGAACLFYKVCVDAADDFVFIGKKEVQGVENIVRVMGSKDRLIVIFIRLLFTPLPGCAQ